MRRAINFLEVALQLAQSCRGLCMARRHHRATLVLIGQSLELILKAELLEGGVPEEILKRQPYGHDLVSMLAQPECASLRAEMEAKAIECARQLEERGMRSAIGPEISKTDVFWQMIDRLAELHSPQSGFALRYPSAGGTYAPVPVWLYLVTEAIAWERVKARSGLEIFREPFPAELCRWQMPVVRRRSGMLTRTDPTRQTTP